MIPQFRKLRNIFLVLALFFVLMPSSRVSGQQVYDKFYNTVSDKVKAEYLYSFSKFIVWPGEDKFKEFGIGIYGNDTTVYKYVDWIIKWRKVKKVPIRMYRFSSVNDIKNVQVLYVARLNCGDVKKVQQHLAGTHTLIVSDSCSSAKYSMLNFTPTRIVRIESNEENLAKEDLVVPSFLISMGVQYEEDWQDLYKQTDSLLAEQKEMVMLQRMELDVKKQEILKKYEEINLLNDDIIEKEKSLGLQQGKLNTLALEIGKTRTALKEQAIELMNKIESIREKEKLLGEQEKEIELQTRVLMEQNEEIKNQTDKISEQSGIIFQTSEQLKKQQIIIVAGIVILILLSLFGLYVLRNNRIRRRINMELSAKNEEITAQRDAILDQKNKISAQKDEIEAQRDEIEAQRDEIEAQRNAVEFQRDRIVQQNKEMTDSILYARRIQKAVIHTEDELRTLLNDYFVFFEPRDIVSGDFFWVSKQSGRTVVSVADCTGHGVPGAFMSMLGLANLNDIINKDKISDPAEILNRLRNEVIEALQQKEEFSIHKPAMQTVKDGMDMAVVSIDMDAGKLFFAGANNPLYHISDGVLNEYRGDKMPVSIHDEMPPFSQQEISFKPNDCFYLFSDGYADQFGGNNVEIRNKGGKKLKPARLRNLLVSISGLPMKEQKVKVKEFYLAWKGELEQVDDITVFGFRL